MLSPAPAEEQQRAGSLRENGSLRSWAWIWLPLSIYLLTRVVGYCLLIASPAGRPWESVVPVLANDSFPLSLTTWDGQWYRLIVEQGYPAELPTDASGAVQQNPWAFFPLYPALVRLLMTLGLPYSYAAPGLSLLLGAVAFIVLFAEVRRVFGGFSAALTVALMCSAPSAMIYGAAYTESLALLLIVLALRALRQRRIALFLLWCTLLALTRPIVLVLAAVVGVVWIGRWLSRAREPFPVRERWRWAGVAVACAALFVLWPLVAALRTGEPMAYMKTQGTWGGTDDPGTWPTWLRYALIEHLPGTLTLVLLILAIFGALAWQARGMNPGMRSWTVLYPLFILGTATPALNLVRYLALTIIPGLALPAFTRHWSRSAKALAVLGVIAVGAWLQSLWIAAVWVPGSGYFP